MKLRALRFRNICAYGNKWSEIRFDIAGKVIGVVGSIGTGKTSALFDTAFFAFFGKPFREDVTKRDLVNRTNDRDLEVEAEFENLGSEWVISRGIKPDYVRIKKDGRELPLDSHVLLTQKFIEKKVLRVNQQIMTQMFMLALGNFKSFFDLSIGERRGLFEEILRISVFAEMQKEIKQKEKTIEKSLAESQVALRLTEEKIESYRKQLSKIDQMTVEPTVSDADLSKLKLELAELTEKKREMQIEQKAAEADLKQITDALRDIDADYRDADKELNRLTSKKRFYEKNTNCPECGQSLAASFVGEAIAHLDVAIKEQDSVKLRCREKLDDGKELHSDLSELAKQISGAMLVTQSNIGRLSASISYSETKKPDDRATIRVNMEEEIASTEKKKGELAEEKEELLQMQGTTDLFKKVLGDTGLKRFIYERFLPLLNSYVNENLASFNFDLNFSLDENLKERLWRKAGQTIPFGTLSNGEKEVVEISFLFALQKFLEKVYDFRLDVTFADELFDSSLDAETIELIVNFLHRDVDKKIVIISHSPNMKEFFDNIYVVRKDEAGFSVIEREA